MKIKWLRRALTNLDDLAAYIARDNPKAAASMVVRIMSVVEGLGSHPSLGRPGRVAGTRELVVSGTPFIVPYRVRDQTVEIICVFHSARRWPDRF